jgi:hypothetical protein
VEASIPRMATGVIPAGEIDMTDDERKIVSLGRMDPSSVPHSEGCFITQHKRTNFKMDVFMLPILSLLYLMNGLDRANIGNASVGGLLFPSK